MRACALSRVCISHSGTGTGLGHCELAISLPAVQLSHSAFFFNFLT